MTGVNQKHKLDKDNKVDLYLSVIIPAFNESASLADTVLELYEVIIKNRLSPAEIIIIDDGSSDNTRQVVRNIISKWQNGKSLSLIYIPLTRNFGKEAAVLAGYKVAAGQIVGCMDADGQHPPSAIPKMLKKMENDNVDMVIGVRTNQDHKKIGFMSKIFYDLTKRLGDNRTIKFGTDFRFIRRNVLESFTSMREHGRVNRSLMDWTGFSYVVYPFNSRDRFAGKPTFSTSKLIKLALDGIISSGTRPLAIILPLGLILCSLSALAAFIGLANEVIDIFPSRLNLTSQGYALLLIIFLFGINFIVLGTVAVYIGSIFTEVQDRPIFIIDENATMKT